MERKLCIGLIVGNRGFFPGHLCKTGRTALLDTLEKQGVDCITLNERDSQYGSVESWADVKKCSSLFRKHRDRIDGIVVTLPNFGDERGVADTIRLSGLQVPVLIHAWPDEPGKMDIANRRDSFCGKISVCNNLIQYRIPFTLTQLHTVAPKDTSFAADLKQFLAVCRVVRGLQNLKLGAIGTRPAAFKTVRYSEKVLEQYGISVDTLDLSEVISRVGKLSGDRKEVRQQVELIKNSMNTCAVSAEGLLRMARLKLVIERWLRENNISAFALQCWTSLEDNLGIVPCAVMSILSNSLRPAACEVDITGALGMYILQLASGTPSALVDWNNNYGADPDKAVLFHCSNLPAMVFKRCVMSHQEIISNSVGKENAYGAVVGTIRPGPCTFFRLTTDETRGVVRGYIGEGRITTDPLVTFGGVGVLEVRDLQKLLRLICEQGYEHHAVLNLAPVAETVREALTKYRGWEIHRHG